MLNYRKKINGNGAMYDCFSISLSQQIDKYNFLTTANHNFINNCCSGMRSKLITKIALIFYCSGINE